MQSIATVAQTGDYDLTVTITLSTVDAFCGMVEFLDDCVRISRESGYNDIADAINNDKNRLTQLCNILYPVCKEVRAGTKDLSSLMSAFETVGKDLLTIHDKLTCIPTMIGI